MGILTSLLSPVKEARAVNESTGLWEKQQGWTSAAGVDVSPETALNFISVYACVRILAETVASLPLIVYRRRADGGKERATDFQLYSLLHDQPNQDMTSFQFRETVMGHVATWGNGYAQVRRTNGGEIYDLWPLRPDRMSIERAGNQLVYVYDKGEGDTRRLPADTVLHVAGLGFDGVSGYSPIQIARQAIGLGMAADEFGARFFSNDARPGIVLQHPGHLGDEAYKNLKDSWEESHGGVAQSHKPAILEEGMTIKEVGLPPQDAQFLETRKFQATEIARLYRIPPHMIADLDRATFSNIEQQSLEFVVHTLRPWLVRWEQAISHKLLTQAERNTYFVEFLVDGLLRGDIQSRYGAYATGRGNGWLSANDVRQLENMNPIQGGDVYLIPLNMVPAGTTPPAPAPAPAAGAPTTTRSQDASRKSQDAGRRVQVADAEKVAEERSYKSARARNRLTHAYQRMFRDVFGRVIRREVADVGAAAKKMIGSRGATEERDTFTFTTWLSQFYREHQEFTNKAVTPLYRSFGDAVAAAAQDEVDASQNDYSENLGKFTSEYVDAFARRHSGISREKITSALERAQRDGTDPEAAVQAELETWTDPKTSRADDTTMWESVRFGNAIAATVFALAGRQYIKWHSFGDSCPYCKHLNGRKIGITETFLQPGEELKPDGVDKPLTVSNKVHHPPAHGGCDCTIGAG